MDSDHVGEKGQGAAYDELPSPSHAETGHKHHKHMRVLLVAVAVIIILCDLITKILVVSTLEGRRIIHWGFIDFVVIRNPGAAFSIATGSTWILTLIALTLVVVIIRLGRKLESLAWAWGFGLILGGALGNLIDRFFRAPSPFQGHVVDFISIGWWPVFNIADSAICCGVIVMLIEVLRGINPDGERDRTSDKDSSSQN